MFAIVKEEIICRVRALCNDNLIGLLRGVPQLDSVGALWFDIAPGSDQPAVGFPGRWRFCSRCKTVVNSVTVAIL